MPDCNGEAENRLVNRARGLLATYENMAELIRIGAYKQGSDTAVDEAIHYYDALETFLKQRKDEMSTLAEGRSEEHTSELQSLMRSSYAVFCLKKKTSTK